MAGDPGGSFEVKALALTPREETLAPAPNLAAAGVIAAVINLGVLSLAFGCWRWLRRREAQELDAMVEAV